MASVSATLGRSFVASGLIPALAFLTATDLVVVSRLWEGRHLFDVELAGVEGVAYVLGATFLGLLLLALNTPIIKLYENGFYLYPLVRWLRQRNLGQHRQRYTALLERQKDYCQAVEAGDEMEIEAALAKLQAVHRAIAARFHNAPPLPHDTSYVMPTSLGNAFAVMEEYSYERYGMDAIIYWPRLTAVIPDGYHDEIGDLKTTLDFWLNLSLLSGLFGVSTFAAAVWLATSAVVIYGLLAALLAYGFYHMAVTATQEFGELVTSAFDVFRGPLREKIGLRKRGSLRAEQGMWLMLASFIRTGEEFYFPGATTTNGDSDLLLLQDELQQHRHNLFKLRKQEAVYAVGEKPLHLLNQIEAEERAIQELEVKLTTP